MSKKLPIVAIVGRANVGKSSLFNTILNKREAIVAREAGTTRDSVWAKADYNHQQFWLVDTAGMKSPEDEFEFTIQEQIIQAADSADVIWVVVEADVPVTEDDRRVAKLALKSRKPVFLLINKYDRAKGQDLSGFDRLGITPIIRTSATQGVGIDQLLDTLITNIPHASESDDHSRIKVAIVGRPNVGKSLLFNSLAKKQQAIVADRAGTTRDVNRTNVRYEGRTIELMDTAGLRRPGRIERGVEHFSALRTISAIEEADIAVLLIDLNEPSVALDQKIAGMISDAGKGLILVVSKWDLAPDDPAVSREDLTGHITFDFQFVPWAPLLFLSGLTGQNVTKLFDLIMEIDRQRSKVISTRELNKWLSRTILTHPPAGLKNRAPKLNYMVQETDNPIPAFKIFGSHTRFIHWSYRRYMERSFREAYGYEGTAVQFWYIEKHETHKHGESPTRAKKEDY